MSLCCSHPNGTFTVTRCAKSHNEPRRRGRSNCLLLSIPSSCCWFSPPMLHHGMGHRYTTTSKTKTGSSGSSCRRSYFHDTRWWASTQRTALCCSTAAADIQCPNTSLILTGNDSPLRLLDKTLNLVIRTLPTYASSNVIIFLLCLCYLNLLNVYFGSQMFYKELSRYTMYSLIIII